MAEEYKVKTFMEYNAERGVNVTKKEYAPLVEEIAKLFKQGE
tara:strand:+ start:964 stop:1089 length:126 start_codon:yes stop_codon:yes gene_type:complete